jgi:hypothetical protein
MSFDLVDADGSEIRVTAWNDQVDQFQDMVQVCAESRQWQGPARQAGWSPACSNESEPSLWCWAHCNQPADAIVGAVASASELGLAIVAFLTEEP